MSIYTASRELLQILRGRDTRFSFWWEAPKPLTPANSFRLTKEVFAEAERDWPDLMEPWSIRAAESIDVIEQQKIMREGLGATFKERRQPVKYPTLRHLLEAA